MVSLQTSSTFLLLKQTVTKIEGFSLCTDKIETSTFSRAAARLHGFLAVQIGLGRKDCLHAKP